MPPRQRVSVQPEDYDMDVEQSSSIEQDQSRQQPRRAAKAASRGRPYEQQPSTRSPSESVSPAASMRSPELQQPASQSPYLDTPSSSRHARSPSNPSSASESRQKTTKTGRISRALKGQRVHKCDVCDKLYTRAEHLRRHQLNHKGPFLSCNYPGCERKFVREDLLARHIEDNHDTFGAEHDRDSSTASRRSASSLRRSPADVKTADAAAASQRASAVSSKHFGQANVRQTAGGTLIAGGNPGSTDPSSGVAQHEFNLQLNDLLSPGLDTLWSPDPLFASPSLFESPGPEPALDFSHPALTYNPHPSAISCAASDFLPLPFDVADSSSTTTSQSTMYPVWQTTDDVGFNNGMMSPCDSEQSGYTGNEFFANTASMYASSIEALSQGYPELPSFAELDSAERTEIYQELNSIIARAHTGVPQQSVFLRSYWQHFHPIFPVLHRPSFDEATAPPLLVALMMTIGASFLDDEAKNISRSLRELCFKLLNKRSDVSSLACRFEDSATIFLAEAFSLYRSRRPSVQFSRRFETMYAVLQLDKDVFAPFPPEELSLPYDVEEEVAHASRQRWRITEGKRRLLVACFCLESQQATLFDTGRRIMNADIPFPCSSPLWEASDLAQWHEQAQLEHNTAWYLSDALQQITHPGVVFDSFQGLLLASWLTRSRDALLQPQSQDFINIMKYRDSTTAMEYHAISLANYTPVRSLLAISGESFVLTEKLATRDQFMQAEADLTSWTRSTDARLALQHATSILDIAYKRGRRGLLHEDWALYLAALVCWACSMWTLLPKNASSASLPETYPFPPAHSVEEQMLVFLHKLSAQSGTSSPTDSDSHAHSPARINETDVRSCLAWVRSRIAGQLGGIVEDAVNVLDRLMTNARTEDA